MEGDSTCPGRHARGLVKEKAWIKYVPFEEALRHADFVSVHVPLLRKEESATPTYHLFNEETLRLMKSTAFLVNTSRGPVVDEAALYDVLAAGRLAGAALDVFDREPYEPVDGSRDLRTLPNVILTPHTGSNTTEANRGMAARAVQNVEWGARGEFGRMDLLNREVVTLT